MPTPSSTRSASGSRRLRAPGLAAELSLTPPPDRTHRGARRAHARRRLLGRPGGGPGGLRRVQPAKRRLEDFAALESRFGDLETTEELVREELTDDAVDEELLCGARARRATASSASWSAARSCASSAAGTTRAAPSSPSTPAPAAPSRRTGPRCSCACTCAGSSAAASRSRSTTCRRATRPASRAPRSPSRARTSTACWPRRRACTAWCASAPSTRPTAATPASPPSRSARW